MLHREKRLVGKNPLRCMRFIEAKFQLNKYATFSNQGSASAQLQSKFSTIDFLSTFLAKFLPAALHFLHFAKNGKKKERRKTISSTSMQIVLQSMSKGVRGLMHLKPDTWQVLKDDGVAVEHHMKMCLESVKSSWTAGPCHLFSTPSLSASGMSDADTDNVSHIRG